MNGPAAGFLSNLSLIVQFISESKKLCQNFELHRMHAVFCIMEAKIIECQNDTRKFSNDTPTLEAKI